MEKESFISLERMPLRLHLVNSNALAGNMSVNHEAAGSGEAGRNYREYLRMSGFEPKSTALMNLPQPNGASVIEVTKNMLVPDAEGRVLVKTDALVTKGEKKDGIALALLTGDCLPIVIADTQSGVLALAHGSRKSIGAGIIPAVLQRMVDMGARPENMRVSVGPSIHKESYLFSPDKLDALATEMQDRQWDDFLPEDDDGSVHVDVHGRVRKQLIDGSIPPGNIAMSPIDTRVDEDYFSHARASEMGEPERRFVTAAMLV